MPEKELYTGIELLQRVAEGDHDAFRSLFQLYADKMHAAVYSYTKSRFLSEELVQEVFIRLWKYRGQLQHVKDPSAYLFRMVFNHINTYLKRAANEQRLLDRVRSLADPNPEETLRRLEANEMNRIITAAVNSLPPQKKIIYQMSREQGLSYQEIASQLNISPNTVRNHLVEATKLLRNYLKEYAFSASLLIFQHFF